MSSVISGVPQKQERYPAETPTYSWRSRFDRTNPRHLIILFAIVTFGFGCIYAYLAEFHCGDGIKPCGWTETIPYALEDGLYFSIITETTVGYGDFVPRGYSRIFACVQTLCGLCIAGLFVTKLTTGPSGKTKLLVDRMSGEWIEFCDTPSGIRTSLVYIRMEKGLFRYDGINFDDAEKPNYLGIFEGSSEPTSAINGPEIWFDYSNLEGDDSAFKSGRTSLRFSRVKNVPNQPGTPSTIDEVRESSSRPYDFFKGFAVDKEMGMIPMFGYRLLHKKEANFSRSRSFSKVIQGRRSNLVKAWLPICEYKGDVFANIRKLYEERAHPAKH